MTKKKNRVPTTVVNKLTPTKDFKLPVLPKKEKKSFYSYRPYAKISTEHKFALVMLVALLLAMPIGLGLTIQPKIPLLSKAEKNQSPPQTNSVPSISTATLPVGQLSQGYSTTISGLDENISDNLTLFATNLPLGLNISSCKQSAIELNTSKQKLHRISCEISGVPEQSGVFQTIFTLYDGTEKINKTIPITIIR